MIYLKSRILKTNLLLLIMMLISFSASAATITGKVLDDYGYPLGGVNVILDGTNQGAASNINGTYKIENVEAGKYLLRVSLVGYTTIEKPVEIPAGTGEILNIEEIKLAVDPVALEELMFKLQAMDSRIDADAMVRKEVVSSEDMQSSTQDGGVLSALSKKTGLNTRPCALCGSAGIGMQGLDPSYTEINVDGMPVLSGLGSLYGLDGVAVSDVSQVEYVKGSSSSEFGAGAVAGGVDLVTMSAQSKPAYRFRISGGTTGRHTVSIGVQKPTGKLSNRISLTYSGEPVKIDENGDRLTDTPQYSRFNAGYNAQLPIKTGTISGNFRGYGERRFAGDVDWTKDSRGSESVYGREIFTNRGEVSFRYAHNPASWGNWSIESSNVFHQQDSWYGSTEFDATQVKSISRLSINRRWNVLNSTLLQGLYTYEEYRDNLELENETNRIDNIPGVMIQHTWIPSTTWTLQGGIRSEIYQEDGFVPTFRGSALFNPTKAWGFRLSGGTGYRPVTIFSLDKAVHAGFDNVIVPNELEPERSINGSLNVNYRTASPRSSFQVDLNGFYTVFENKAILAYGHHEGTTEYSNAEEAFSRGFELQLTWSHHPGWTLGLGGTVTDVQYKNESGWHFTEMQNKYTADASLLKEWALPQISAEIRANLYGPQALPEGRSRSDSPVYTIFSTGISKKFNGLTLALNVENLTDWTQPDDPFVFIPGTDASFIDSAMIYGPMLGRTFQASIDYNF